jgi:hypothetical protein
MILQPDDFDAFFGKPIPSEGFTINDALHEVQKEQQRGVQNNPPDRIADPRGGQKIITQRISISSLHHSSHPAV